MKDGGRELLGRMQLGVFESQQFAIPFTAHK